MSTQHGQPRRSFPPGRGLLFGRFQLLWPADPVPAAAAAAAEATTDRRARRFLFLLVIDGEPTELEWPGPTADDQLRRQWGLAAVFLRPVAGNLLEQALRFILEFQRGRCIYCSLRGKADDGHKYSQCPTSTMRMFRTVRPQSYARPDRNAGCYHCGMPMDFCRALVRTQSSNVPEVEGAVRGGAQGGETGSPRAGHLSADAVLEHAAEGVDEGLREGLPFKAFWLVLAVVGVL
ncbi:unnamed protein product [Tilletia controversa]|nr:unnamed protein product [Tilletia controversa]